MRRAFSHPFGPLLLFSITLAALLSTYVAAGVRPSEMFQILAAFCWWILLTLWLVADARRQIISRSRVLYSRTGLVGVFAEVFAE